ncbi:hypothetical protein IDH44_21825 [Paenibacillus sp. IB182496]|uniref:Uncharacterized protein n=1 Tax=Paenibacillus sabuli TaxID=2772509 RepID=A0A927BVY0_9BACL|nr:hypothetical protein [Paenibacillus sabuli]MBD2847842.1 hypothetical protein [Paenibacillus sabuli]
MPIPLPIPVPIPPGPGARSVTVVLNGGPRYPFVTQAYRVPFRPGLTVAEALAFTGAVRFGPSGNIVSVGGVFVGGNQVPYALRLNGRTVPLSLLYAPLQPGDTVEIQLF